MKSSVTPRVLVASLIYFTCAAECIEHLLQSKRVDIASVTGAPRSRSACLLLSLAARFQWWKTGGFLRVARGSCHRRRQNRIYQVRHSLYGSLNSSEAVFRLLWHLSDRVAGDASLAIARSWLVRVAKSRHKQNQNPALPPGLHIT